MQYTIFVLLTPIAAIITGVVFFHAGRYQQAPGEARSAATALRWYLVIICGFLITNALELLAATPGATLFLARFDYLFITFTPVAWFAFVLTYTGNDRWLTPSRFWLFCLSPIITILFVWTNDLHGLIWQSYSFRPAGPFLALGVGAYGAWFWVHTIYSYSLFLVGGALVVITCFRSHRLYRRQSIWVLAGALIPLLVNLVYVFRLIPGLQKDFSPITFTFAGLAFAVGISRYRLLDLAPVARAALVDGLEDGVIVLDAEDRVVDINPAARRIIHSPDKKSIGEEAANLLPFWQEFAADIPDNGIKQIEITLGTRGAERIYDLHLSPLPGRGGRRGGRLITLHDISQRRRIQAELEQNERRLRAFICALPDLAFVFDREGHYLEVIGNQTIALAHLQPGEFKDRQLQEDLPAELAAQFMDTIRRTIDSGQPQRLQYPITIKKDPCWFEGRTAPFAGAGGQVESVVWLARDITAHKQAEEALQQAQLVLELRIQERTAELTALNATLEQRVANRTRDLAALYAVSVVASEVQDMDSLLFESLSRTVAALHGEAGAIYLLDNEGDNSRSARLRLAAHKGDSPNALEQIHTCAITQCKADWVIENGEPMLIPDTAGEVDILQVFSPHQHFTLLIVPLRAENEVLGVLALSRWTEALFDLEEVALLSTIADQVGVAVAGDRLRQMAHQAQVLADRQRLSRDLHDSITQSLYGLVAFCEAGQGQIEREDFPAVQQTIARINSATRHALKEMRLFLHELRPSVLEKEGLMGALHQRLAAVEGRADVQARLLADENLHLPLFVEEVLYRIAQEALNNTLRHAEARTITVYLGREGDQAVLEVIDDGCGFDPQTVSAGRMGLANMQARAKAVGGALQISSLPDHGTRLRTTVPLSAVHPNR